MNIKDFLVCPVCHFCLSKNLECYNCHHVYSHKYGVYEVVSQNLSGDQQILWRVTDEDIEKEEIQSNNLNDESQPDLVKDYFSRISDETKQAQRKQADFMDQLINSLTGVVCDLATGMGGNLQRLLNAEIKDFSIICTDIDKRILAMTRKKLKTDDSRVYYIATDGRYMSFKDNSFDYITSVAAFGNIPESDKVAKEMYRVLKPKGKLIIEGTYIDKGSKSFELAKSMGLEKGMVEEFLTQELKNAGFINVASTIVAKAIWAENPYDRLPVAGDMQYYCIIQAEKC
ncbi:MAG: methyltransferase domain-containing protein [Candidatus Izemoplasmatales bacterium]